MRPPSPTTVHLLIAVLCLIWGSTWLVIQEGLEDLPPFTSLGLRFLVAAGVFALVAPALHRFEGGRAPGWRLTLAMGLLVDAGSYAVIYWAEQTVPSGLTSVLFGMFPLFMAVAGHFFLVDEPLTRGKALGLLLGLAGVALLFAADLRAIAPEAVVAGAVLLLSPLLSVIGNTIIKRHGAEVSSALLCRNGLAVAAVITIPPALWFERDQPLHWTPAAVFGVLYLAILGTVVAFAIYFWLLRYAKAGKLALISYIAPVVALLLGWAVRGEPVGWTTLAGTALIALGVGLAGRR